MIKLLKAAYPDITHPWYTENEGAIGTFEIIQLYFKSLKYFGLGRGYYPKPFKIILIMHPDNPKTGKQFGLYRTFKVCTCAHYLGSFIDDNSFKRCWMQDCTVM